MPSILTCLGIHRRSATLGRVLAVAHAGMLLWVPAFAQEPPAAPAADVSELAKKTQNPVGDLISVPLQFNFNTAGDLEDGTYFNLNVQPVIPFKVSADWHVIARTIVPINSFPGPGGLRFSGVGDLTRTRSCSR